MGGSAMVSRGALVVMLVNLVDGLAMPALPGKRGRGHPQVYPDRLFLKALVIMIVRCKLQNSVSYFWDSSMSYCLNCSAWRSVLDDREQVKSTTPNSLMYTMPPTSTLFRCQCCSCRSASF